MESVSNKVLWLIVICFSIFSVYQWINTPKLGYVRSQELVYGFQGMSEMQSAYKAKKGIREANLDSLKIDYQQTVNEIKRIRLENPDAEPKDLYEKLQIEGENIDKYAEIVNEENLIEEEEMLTGVLEQVNSFVKDYAIRNNYDIIFGTTLSGNILYGEKYIDVTDMVLNELNSQYYGR